MGNDTYIFERTILLFSYLSAAVTHTNHSKKQSADGSVCKEHQSAPQTSVVVHFACNYF